MGIIHHLSPRTREYNRVKFMNCSTSHYSMKVKSFRVRPYITQLLRNSSRMWLSSANKLSPIGHPSARWFVRHPYSRLILPSGYKKRVFEYICLNAVIARRLKQFSCEDSNWHFSATLHFTISTFVLGNRSHAEPLSDVKMISIGYFLP